MSVSSSLPQPNYQSYVKKTSARAVQTAGQHIPRHVSLVRETSSGTLLSNFNNYSQKGATTTSVGEYLCATPPPSPVIGPSAPGSATAAQSTSSGTQPTQLSYSSPVTAGATVAVRPPPLLDLVPPFRFAMVEEGVYRGAYPVLRNCYFLQERGIKTIVSTTPEKPTYDLKTFCQAQGITLKYIQAERYKEEAQLLPGDIAEALAPVLDVAAHPVYIHCLDGKHVTGLVIMALRKLMCWDISAAHREYVRFTKEAFDEVAFMKDYTGPLTIPLNFPKFLWGEASPKEVDPHDRFFTAGNPNIKINGIKVKFVATASKEKTSEKTTTAVHADPVVEEEKTAVAREEPTVLGTPDAALSANLPLPPTAQVLPDGAYLDILGSTAAAPVPSAKGSARGSGRGSSTPHLRSLPDGEAEGSEASRSLGDRTPLAERDGHQSRGEEVVADNYVNFNALREGFGHYGPSSYALRAPNEDVWGGASTQGGTDGIPRTAVLTPSSLLPFKAHGTHPLVVGMNANDATDLERTKGNVNLSIASGGEERRRTKRRKSL